MNEEEGRERGGAVVIPCNVRPPARGGYAAFRISGCRIIINRRAKYNAFPFRGGGSGSAVPDDCKVWIHAGIEEQARNTFAIFQTRISVATDSTQPCEMRA